MTPLPDNPYIRDILDQPDALERTRAGLQASPALEAAAARLARGEFRQVLLTGMGSSLHALHPLRLELAVRGLPVAMADTAELVYYMEGALAPSTLVVAVSQSGRSVETVRLLEVNRRRACIIGVTNTPDSPLAEGADAVVMMQAGREATVSCKTYVATLVALAWLGGVLAGVEVAGLETVAPAAAAYLAGWRAHVDEVRDTLRGVRHLFLAGRGPSRAAAHTGGLIVKEAAHFPAEGMSGAAFRHGPFEMVRDGIFLLAFAGDEPTASLMARLAADVTAAGGRAALVSPDAPEGVFRVPAVTARVRPVVEILPVQMATLGLAALHGHEAGAFHLAAKVTVTE